MIFSDLGEQYYDWLHKIVCGEWEPRNLSFHRLLMYLHNRAYIPACEMHQCRAEDGVNLRYRFASECDIPYDKIDAEFHGVPCSMLEMMVPCGAHRRTYYGGFQCRKPCRAVVLEHGCQSRTCRHGRQPVSRRPGRLYSGQV